MGDVIAVHRLTASRDSKGRAHGLICLGEVLVLGDGDNEDKGTHRRECVGNNLCVDSSSNAIGASSGAS